MTNINHNKVMEQNVPQCHCQIIEKNHLIINNNSNELSKKYIYNIKNLIEIDKEMITNIGNMSDKEMMDIIIEFNAVVESIKIFLGKNLF
jgi:hypothetical protein